MNLKFNTVYVHKEDMSKSLSSLQSVMAISGTARGAYANRLAGEVFGPTVRPVEDNGTMYINTETSRRLDIRTVHKDGTANFTPNSTDIDDRDFMISTVHVEGTAVYTRFLMITGAHASRLLGRHSDQIAKTVVDDLHDMFPTKVYSRNKVVSFAFSDAE